MAQYSNITTSKTERIGSDGKVFDTRNTRTTTSTQSQKVLTRREKADQAIDSTLGVFGRFEMIGITIITLAITPVLASPIAQVSYLENMYPNYNQPFENNSVADPIGHFDYIQFGDQAVANIVATLQIFSVFGDFARGFWETITLSTATTETLGGFADTFTNDRWYEISLIDRNGGTNGQIWNELTATERAWILANHNSLNELEVQVFKTTRWYLMYIDTYDLFGGGVKWFFTESSVYTILGGI
jgi:hypothetical protein